MNDQSILEVKTNDLHIFLQRGFFDFSSYTPILHSHGYAEIHLVISGHLRFFAGEQTYTFAEGSIFAIPSNMYHYCLEKEASAQSLSFQIKKDMNSFKSHTVPLETLRSFAQEIPKAERSGNYAVLTRYIRLFCSLFLDTENVPSIISKDYSLIINEFFSNRYNQDVTLLSLAKELHLSEKQTSRLVKKHTGYTFNKKLTMRRISIADYLMRSTSMTMSEIAEYVGFKSYSGFWKACRGKAYQPEEDPRFCPADKS